MSCYYSRIDKNVCPYCGKKHTEKTKSCKTCKDKIVKKTRIIREQRKKENKCYRCGEKLQDNKYVSCFKCRLYNNKMEGFKNEIK